MKILLHHTINKKIFNEFDDNFNLNINTNKELYIEVSRYIDSELLECESLFILVIAFFDVSNKKREFKYFEVSRYREDIMVNTFRKKLREFFEKKIGTEVLGDYQMGYYQIIDIYD